MGNNLGDGCGEVRGSCDSWREAQPLVLETDRVRLLGSGDVGSTPVCSGGREFPRGWGRRNLTLQLARRVLPLPSAAPMSSRLGLVGILETHRVRAEVPGQRGALGFWWELGLPGLPSHLSPSRPGSVHPPQVGGLSRCDWGVLSFSRRVAMVV